MLSCYCLIIIYQFELSLNSLKDKKKKKYNYLKDEEDRENITIMEAHLDNNIGFVIVFRTITSVIIQVENNLDFSFIAVYILMLDAR